MTNFWPDELSPEAALLRSSPTLSPDTAKSGVSGWLDVEDTPETLWPTYGVAG